MKVPWYPDGDTMARHEYNSLTAYTYTFDKVFGPQANTMDVYDVAARPVVKAAMEGVNECNFCFYGTIVHCNWRRIFLIYCPGVVYQSHDIETDIILKRVVRVTNLEDASEHIGAKRPSQLQREVIYHGAKRPSQPQSHGNTFKSWSTSLHMKQERLTLQQPPWLSSFFFQ
ncbi:unnamed protein product [Eruca vesicaria subsp. sativa]|uniref:Kinesin motor domain-containing protein n=1 Tax=Eruca vesicaria subsp. sativa TaxID=29727 RepID=A0ABC8M2Z9_ERUVS|nr:unnamed protein product [Eruca vesicaria subsp. sativa]